MIRYGLNESANLDYLDGADWTWKTVRIGNAVGRGRQQVARSSMKRAGC